MARSRTGTVRIWDLALPAPQAAACRGHSGAVYVFATCADLKRVYSGSAGGSPWAWGASRLGEIGPGSRVNE
jgi:hypothetical protein